MGGSASFNTELRGNFVALATSVDVKKSVDGEARLTGGQSSEWSKLWETGSVGIEDVFTCLPAAELRRLRDDKPQHFARLCISVCNSFCAAVRNPIVGQSEQLQVINCSRILVRLFPFMFEEIEWRNFFWSVLPVNSSPTKTDKFQESSMAEQLLSCMYMALFCPRFTVDETCTDENFVWYGGVGTSTFQSTTQHNISNRIDILRLMLTCCSENLYLPKSVDAHLAPNKWIVYLSSQSSKQLLPLLISLINTLLSFELPSRISAYNPFAMSKQAVTDPCLAELCAQLLCVLLEEPLADNMSAPVDTRDGDRNLFVHYLSRIHLIKDYEFILHGFVRLFNYSTTYPLNLKFDNELLIVLWKFLKFNQGFFDYVLRSDSALMLVYPLLYCLNDCRINSSKQTKLHLSMLILGMFSTERNFGVRLNKQCGGERPVLADIPRVTGTFADLVILVLHKLITSPSFSDHDQHFIYECLLSIVFNISPYVKSLTGTTANKLVHLFEVFSNPKYLLKEPANHLFVFLIVNVLNNIIHYHFDGNAHVVYAIIRRRQLFYNLMNLPNDDVFPKVLLSTKNISIATSENQLQQQGKNSTCAFLKPLLRKVHVVTMSIDGQRVDEFPSNGAEISTDLQNWEPNIDWVKSWHSKLQLGSIERMLQVLFPQVERMCLDQGLTGDDQIIAFLRSGTLVGLLPTPQKILVRLHALNEPAVGLWVLLNTWNLIALCDRSTQSRIWSESKMSLSPTIMG